MLNFNSKDFSRIFFFAKVQFKNWFKIWICLYSIQRNIHSIRSPGYFPPLAVLEESTIWSWVIFLTRVQGIGLEIQESGCHKPVIWDDSGNDSRMLWPCKITVYVKLGWTWVPKLDSNLEHIVLKHNYLWSKIVLDYNHLKCVHSLASELVQLDYTLAYLLIYFDAGSCILAN